MQVSTTVMPDADPFRITWLARDALDIGVAVDAEAGRQAELTGDFDKSPLKGSPRGYPYYSRRDRAGGRDAGSARREAWSGVDVTGAGPAQGDDLTGQARAFGPAGGMACQRRLGSVQDVLRSLSTRRVNRGDMAEHLADGDDNAFLGDQTPGETRHGAPPGGPMGVAGSSASATFRSEMRRETTSV